MSPIESLFFKYIKQSIDAGGLAVSHAEVMLAVIPSDRPDLARRPVYRYALDRLHRRHVVNAIRNSDGVLYYFIGNAPSVELLRAMGRDDILRQLGRI
jgi:hypothetical protein